MTDTICPYCGVGCALDLHVQDNEIVKVTSPLDSSVTDGHLCIKGRFGFEFVQNRGPKRLAESRRAVEARDYGRSRPPTRVMVAQLAPAPRHRTSVADRSRR